MASPHLVVPDWQRSYSWTKQHVETFWNDLKRFDARSPGNTGREYFLGSIVLVSGYHSRNLLLDGQQRVATSAILLSCIRDYIQAFRENAAIRIQQRYLADYDDASNAYVYKLTLNEYDREYFKRLILEYKGPEYQAPVGDLPSHHLILEAREFLKGALDLECGQGTPQQGFERAIRVQSVLTEMVSVIEVSSTDEDSASDVFETLNDRGIGLSTPDLLRNLVMSRAGAANRPTVVDLWRDVLQFDSDNKIKSFLRHYWISHYGDVKTQSLYREIKEFILDNHIDSVVLSRSLSDASDVYREIVSGRDDDVVLQELLRDILMLGAGAAILFPYVLAVKQCANVAQQADLVRLAINSYVRHSIIAQRDNSRLENVVYDAARSLRDGNGVEHVRELISAVIPDDAEVRASFERLSVTNRSTQRYLLRKLEQQKRVTEELDIAVPSRVHVEHIYPQTPPDERRLPQHERWVNRVGNLTLLSARINAELRNADFPAKKVRYEASQLELTKELLGFDEWSTELITRRQAELAQLVPEIWPV